MNSGSGSGSVTNERHIAISLTAPCSGNLNHCFPGAMGAWREPADIRGSKVWFRADERRAARTNERI